MSPRAGRADAGNSIQAGPTGCRTCRQLMLRTEARRSVWRSLDRPPRSQSRRVQLRRQPRLHGTPQRSPSIAWPEFVAQELARRPVAANVYTCSSRKSDEWILGCDCGEVRDCRRDRSDLCGNPDPPNPLAYREFAVKGIRYALADGGPNTAAQPTKISNLHRAGDERPDRPQLAG